MGSPKVPQPTVSGLVSGPNNMQQAISPFYRRNMTPDKRTSSFLLCRICHEDGKVEELIDPCKCAGSLRLVHASCLEKWLSTSNTDRCEICKYSFMIERRKKPITQSFREWSRSSNIYGPQGIASDVACVIVLTPLCVAATYLCGVGAAAYSRLGFWEGTGLAVLSCLLPLTYCLWLFITVRFHYKSWQQWCGKHQVVKLIVKHKSEETARANKCWMRIQDRNNNSSNNNNNNNNNANINEQCNIRFSTCLVTLVPSNDEPLYCQRDQMSAV